VAELSSAEVVVGGSGAVWVAPADTVGLTLPTINSPFVTPHAAFKKVGFVTEDGINFTDGVTKEDIKAWQSLYPIRKITTEKNSSVEFAMQQWNETTLTTAFGGGTIAELGGNTKYYPPAPGAEAVLALLIDWVDGLNNFRLVMPRGQVSGEVSVNVTRTTSADLPVSFEATPAGAPQAGVDSSQPWYLLTDALVTT
jgi:hypothetical protein